MAVSNHITYQPGDVHVVFNGPARLLKAFLVVAPGVAEMRHVWAAHDVGVGDRGSTDGNEYGHYCKAPPGTGYMLGDPQACGPHSDDGIAYGWWAIPITDDPAGDFAKWSRAGLMIHGGGSASPSPFAPYQGWYATLGCIRMQNVDLGLEKPGQNSLVNMVQYVRKGGHKVGLDIVWAA